MEIIQTAPSIIPATHFRKTGMYVYSKTVYIGKHSSDKQFRHSVRHLDLKTHYLYRQKDFVNYKNNYSD